MNKISWIAFSAFLLLSGTLLAKSNAFCEDDSSSDRCKIRADVMYAAFIDSSGDNKIEEVADTLPREVFDVSFLRCGEANQNKNLALNCLQTDIMKYIITHSSKLNVDQNKAEESQNDTVTESHIYGVGCEYDEVLLPLYSYYIEKDINKATTILKNISEKNIIESDGLCYGGVLGFITGLFMENPQFYDKISNMDFSEKMNDAIELAYDASKLMSWSTIAKTRTFVPKQLNTYWGIFFATGNKSVVEAIATYVQTHQGVFAVRAKASLFQNAKEHSIVKQVLKERGL